MDLDEFAEADDIRTGYRSALDVLPDDVRGQVMESHHGHAVTARWLNSLGYEHITQQMVSHWRRSRGWSRG